MRKYWWLWAATSVITISILLIGPSVFGGTLVSVAGFLLRAALAALLISGFIKYTYGRGVIGLWGILRMVGMVGIMASLVSTVDAVENYSAQDIFWNPNNSIVRSNVILFVAVGIISLFFLSLGEGMLYLDKINNKLDIARKDDSTKILFLRKAVSESLCPRCLGKGWTDAHDIERMGISSEVVPGVCLYCNGDGYVERGTTEMADPTDVNSDAENSIKI